MRKSNDQENDSAFTADIVLAVREGWGQFRGMDGPLLLSRTVANFSRDVDRGWSAARHGGATASHKHPDLFSRRSCSTPDITVMREGGSQLSQCILACRPGCQSPRYWKNVCYGVVHATSGISNLGFAVLKSHRCANRKTYPGYDLEISRIEDADPRSRGYTSLLTATQNTRDPERASLT
ncbi:hypothetical protein BU25DRAFT_200291 [Macroventuria anomochaeta]|uniref:Uncharacterized protein n=1 Tax=Macroventuria anomochaeta TaxID=301207 RepID=A0ACB6RMT8_9PLEO|nr:uncharacterized protein BU25DRAFT_200291 [Macroventuria anomochaeta]KAF2623027.1 hypothetical protein BU25DRAFT_200291 [Macroventuria anomochaeta]